MLGVKRRLTQSEKHKHFVEGGGQPLGNFSLKKSSSLQFLECPQNVVHSRKFADKCVEIDKAKSKSIAHINGEKHLLKLKYKGLIKDEENDDITRTFFLQPGFRFHANGDIRKLRDPRIVPEVEIASKRSSLSLARSNSSHQSLQSSKSGDRNLRKTVSDSSTVSLPGHGDGPKKVQDIKEKEIDIKKAIKEIEHDLAKMKTDKDLIDINKRIQTVRNSLTFIRAHANDIKPPIHHISVNIDDKEKFLRQLRDHGVDKKCSLQEKLSRHCTRLNCMACEFRLKCGSDSMPLIKTCSKDHLKRWEYAPRGSFVSNLEGKDSTSKHLLSNKRSKSKSAKSLSQIKCKSSEQTDYHKSVEKRHARSAGSRNENKLPSSQYVDGRQRKSRPHGLVEKFKERENLNNSVDNVPPNESSFYYDRNYSIGDFSSEKILTVHDVNSNIYDDTSSEQDLAVNSRIDIMNKELAREKDKTMEKVQDFYDTIPDPHPSIKTWRNSSGQLLTWKSKDKSHTNRSQHCSDMTWAQYHRNKPQVSLEHSLHHQFYQSSQEKLTGDPNSIEELKKCRYLRDFKMRKNLIL